MSLPETESVLFTGIAEQKTNAATSSTIFYDFALEFRYTLRLVLPFAH